MQFETRHQGEQSGLISRLFATALVQIAYFLINHPKKISWILWKPFVLSLLKHERLPHIHPFGEHFKIPLPFDRLRGNGILACPTDFFRIFKPAII